MENLGKYIAANKRLFKKILMGKSKDKPSLLVFLTPNLYLFDIYRLIKLGEISKMGFKLKIFLNESTNKNTDKNFKNFLEKIIPVNKTIRLYTDLSQDLYSNEDYLKLLVSIKLEEILKLLKKYKGLSNITMLHLNNFISQYFVIINRETLGISSDCMFITEYREDVFKILKGFDKSKIPAMIKMPEFFVDWKIGDNIKNLEKIIIDKKLNKTTKRILNDMTITFNKIFNSKHSGNLLEELNKINKFLVADSKLEEYYILKDNFKKVISSLNNPLRRKILAILNKKDSLKAEEIRTKMNKDGNVKYTLPNITKHLKILIKSGIVIKINRKYKIKVKRIILDMPIKWFN